MSTPTAPQRVDNVSPVTPRTPSGLALVGRDAAALAVEVEERMNGTQILASPWAGWPADWATPRWGGTGVWTSHVSTVYTCADLYSRQLSTMPVYRMRGTEHLPDLEWMGNPSPDHYADWIEFAKCAVNTYMLRGEIILYALARYTNGYPARFVVLNPDLVSVEWRNGEKWYSIGERRLPTEDICHVKYQTWPGSLRGVSPLEWLARNLLGADKLEQYMADLAENGGIPWGVLSTPGPLTPNAAAENRARWVEASAARGSAPAILSGGMTLQTLTLSPRDMALLDLRVLDDQKLCAAFGVPPYLVAVQQPEGLTYANGGSLFEFWIRSGARPMGKTIASPISAWALPRGQRIEFNMDELGRPPFPELVAAYAQLHSIVDEGGERAITAAEIRQLLRLGGGAPTGAAAITGPNIEELEA